jgi:hypothetical protein
VDARAVLKTETLDLSGRKIVVSEATYLMGIERGRIIGDMTIASARQEDGASAKNSVLVNVYSGVAACSSGDLPTQDEFILMRESDVEDWIASAKRLNPRWFSWMDDLDEALSEAEKKLAVKKKGRKQRR